MQIENLIDTAVDLRISTLRAKETKIIAYSDWKDGFQVSSTTFQEIKGNRDYEVFDRKDEEYKYLYTMKISGLLFFAVSPFLIYEGDEGKVQEE